MPNRNRQSHSAPSTVASDSNERFGEDALISRRIHVVTAIDLEPIDVATWARAYAQAVLALYREQESRAA